MQFDEIEDLRATFARLRRDLADLRWALLERKYRPDQPRVPAGSSNGGRWADGVGLGGLQSGDNPPVLEDAAQRIPGPYRIDLRREENEGGHAIERHVAISNSVLIDRLKVEKLDTPVESIYFLREDSFNDMAAANAYTNDVLNGNPAIMASVSSGKISSAYLEKRYDTPTGREAYRNRGDQDGVIKLRNTFSVGVQVVHVKNAKGFNVRTSYPRNRESQY